MKNNIFWLFGIVLIIVVFSLGIYPTPYIYKTFGGGNGVTYPIKYNWITGETWYYTLGVGWKKDTNILH